MNIIFPNESKVTVSSPWLDETNATCCHYVLIHLKRQTCVTYWSLCQLKSLFMQKVCLAVWRYTHIRCSALLKRLGVKFISWWCTLRSQHRLHSGWMLAMEHWINDWYEWMIFFLYTLFQLFLNGYMLGTAMQYTCLQAQEHISRFKTSKSHLSFQNIKTSGRKSNFVN